MALLRNRSARFQAGGALDRSMDAVTATGGQRSNGSGVGEAEAAPTARPVRAATREAPVEFTPVAEISSFRRLAAAMWPAPADPSIHGSMDIDATAAAGRIAELRAQGVRATYGHLVALSVARAIAAHPEVNVKLRFGGRLERRSRVDVFVSVSTDGGKDLSGAKIVDADRLDVAGLTLALDKGAKRIRDGADPSYEKSRGVFKRLPWWLAHAAVRLSDLATNELDLHLPAQGMPRDPFGSAIVTNVGMFGIDTAFAPLVPLARCPILILVPEVRVRPWVVGDAIVPRPVLRLCATFDHRIIDGFAAGRLARSIRELLENPARL